jgi:hypothetical protein
MSLRVKTLLVAAATMVVLLVIFLVATRLILIDSYARLERQDTAEHVARAVNALTDDLAALERTANDYAAWDDTYDFMESRDPVYLEANYPDSTLLNNRLSLIALISPQGEIVFAKAVDLDTEQEVPITADTLDFIARDPALLRPTQSVSSTVGVVQLADGPRLVAVRPILTSLESGPVRGGLLMARSLSASEIERLGDVTQLDLKLLQPDASLPSEDQAARAALSKQQPVIVRPLDEQVVSGYTWLNDINDDPALLLRVDRTRDIYRQGQTTLSYLVVVLALGGIVVGVVTAGLLEHAVILRLGRLNREVQAIGVSSDFSQRVSPQGKDELGQLSTEINRMLDSLESTEQLLSQREREAITLLDSIPAYAFFKDTASRYILVNQRFCQALHHTREEVTGKTDDDFYPLERAARYRADDVLVMESGEMREMGEETVGTGENAVVLATFKVPLKNEAGEVTGLIGLSFDITDRKRAAQELAVARDQALEALRFKSQLLAHVSHDLRTPINAILGFTEMLQAGIYGPPHPAQQEPLSRIIMSCHQLARLISDLIDQSQLEAGKLTLRLAPFAPADLIGSILAVAGLNAREKGLEFSGHVDAIVPPVILGDYERVHRIVLNLVDNALRFTDTGSVTIHILRPDDTHYAIQVMDTGPGIAPAEQALVFEAFKQGSWQARGRYKGIGLGLSIVKQLTTLMDGQVALSSRPGEGTSFTVILPLLSGLKETI